MWNASGHKLKKSHCDLLPCCDSDGDDGDSDAAADGGMMMRSSPPQQTPGPES